MTLGQTKACYLAAALGAVLTAGCKEEPKGATGSSSERPAASVKPAALKGFCSLLSRGEVSAALGIPELKEPETQGERPVTMCNYGESTNPVRVMIRYETGITAHDMATIRKGFDEHEQPTSDLAGLGDMAFTSRMGTDVSVSFLQGTTQVTISSGDPLEKKQALARKIIQQLE